MLVQAGDDIVQLAPNVTNPDKSLASKCLLDRNTIMIDAHDYVIGVYGGDKELIKNSTSAHSGTLHALRYAYSKSKKIILINPDTLQAERFNF